MACDRSPPTCPTRPPPSRCSSVSINPAAFAPRTRSSSAPAGPPWGPLRSPRQPSPTTSTLLAADHALAHPAAATRSTAPPPNPGSPTRAPPRCRKSRVAVAAATGPAKAGAAPRDFRPAISPPSSSCARRTRIPEWSSRSTAAIPWASPMASPPSAATTPKARALPSPPPPVPTESPSPTGSTTGYATPVTARSS